MMTLGEFKAKKRELETKMTELAESGTPNPEKYRELMDKLSELEQRYAYEQAQKDDTSEEFWAGQNKARFN